MERRRETVRTYIPIKVESPQNPLAPVLPTQGIIDPPPLSARTPDVFKPTVVIDMAQRGNGTWVLAEPDEPARDYVAQGTAARADILDTAAATLQHTNIPQQPEMGNGTNGSRIPLEDLNTLEGFGVNFERIIDLNTNLDHVGEETDDGKQGFNEDPIAVYLRDIATVPLLTEDEEKRLAQQIEAGKWAKSASGQFQMFYFRPSNQPDFEALIKRGKEARKLMVTSNLRLVVAVAKGYVGRGLPLLDLIQEGNIILERAAEKYSWRRGFRFSTYAHWWLRQAFGRAIAEQSRTMRIPVPMVERINKSYRAARVLEQELNREPTKAELAQCLGLTIEQVEDIFRAATVPISLEASLPGYEEDTPLVEIVPDQKPGPGDIAEQNLLKEALESILGGLDPREKEVLRKTYGFEDGREWSGADIARDWGVSREWIRQIRAKALRKLRQPFRARQLREYID